jgi:hypothetical protein
LKLATVSFRKNPAAADLTATFGLSATSIDLELVLEDIHVMQIRWM